MIGRQYTVILWKNILLARRQCVWTLCQIFIPVLIGIPLMLHCYILIEAPLSTSSAAIFNESDIREISFKNCSNKTIIYTSDGPNDSEIKDLLRRAKLKGVAFNDTEQIYEDLNKRARDGEEMGGSADEKSGIENTTSSSLERSLPLFGMEFKQISDLSLSYVVHTVASSLQTVKDLEALITSETSSMQLRDAVSALTLEDLELQQCIFAALHERHREDLDITTQKIDVTSIGLIGSEHNFRRVFLFCYYMLVIISVIVVLVTYNVACDAKMKDFLLLMSVQRIPLLLTTIIGNYTKTFISIAIVLIIPLILSTEAPAFVTFIAVELLGLNAVAIVIFCNILCSSVASSMKQSIGNLERVISAGAAFEVTIILWLVLLYFGVASPPIYGKYWIVSFNHANPIAAFKYVLESFPYFDSRGTAVTMSTLYAYTDVVSPGLSIVALLVDSILIIAFSIVADNIEWNHLWCIVIAMMRGKELEELLKSQSEKHSWHQEEDVREEKPDIDAEDVSKVWEKSGELSVYRFEIRAYPGEVSVLLGHSGAGKTTVYKMICGLVHPTQGCIKILNQDVFASKSYCRSRIGYCPQNSILYDNLTFLEHMQFFYLLKRAKAKRVKTKWKAEAEVLIQSLDMDDIRDKLVSELSPCERRKVSVALAFAGGSRVVLLDEPTNDMDKAAKACLRELINQQKDCRTIMLTTKYMEDAESMGQQIYVMFMGRTICSGNIKFLKNSFSTEYILTITANEEHAEETMRRLEGGIAVMVPGSKVRARESNRVRIELPNSQERLFPDMLAKLDEEKLMKFVRDYKLSYGTLDDTFLRMGIATEANRCLDMEPIGTQEWKLFRGYICIWQTLFLLWKKILLSLFHFPLILSQVLLPILVAAYLGYSLNIDVQLPNAKVDFSPRALKHGRFLVYNPENDTFSENLVRRVINKYPKIELSVFNDSANATSYWSATWPWIVGGVIIDKEDNGNIHYKFLAPKYISHSELIILQLANDLIFGSGRSNINVEFEIRLRKDKFNPSEFALVPVLFMFAHILLTSSFTIVPTEEHSSHFKQLQIGTGLSSLRYWVITAVYDIVISSSMCLLMIFIVFNFNWTFSVSFLILSILYCAINLPLAYYVSTIFTSSFAAFLFLCLFQSLAFIPLFLADGVIEEPLSFIAYAYPSLAFLSSIVTETGKGTLLDISFTVYCVILTINGLFYCMLLLLSELGLYSTITNTTKTFSESFEVPYGDDVNEERERLSRPSEREVVVLKDLVKYQNRDCVLKNLTFGLDKGDSFGLLSSNVLEASTACRLVAGVDWPSSGKIFIEGKVSSKIPSIGFCGTYDSLYPRLTCRQNIAIIAGMIGYRHVHKKADALIGHLGLQLHARRLAGNCSVSQKRRISVALALMTRSKVIVIDEPSKMVDPIARRDIWNLIKSTNLNDRVLLFASSSIEECEMLGTRYGVLVDGRFISTGSTDALMTYHSRLCVLQLELVEQSQKQRVLETVHDVFSKSVPVQLPETAAAELLKWQLTVSPEESLSQFFQNTQKLMNFVPVKNLRLTHVPYDEVLNSFDKKFSNLQKKASKRELVNQLLTVVG